MPSRIFLHVGSPKTGTTFLQQVLWSQRERALEQGLLLPADSFHDHFLASLDVRGLADRPEHPAHASGIWQRFVDQSLAWDGNVLISHELFAAATREQAKAAIEAFGGHAEVHVVLTARDLVRQIPAEWQEHIKHRSTDTFPAFLDKLQNPGSRDIWFWKVQDFADVLRRWGATLPASQVHVVTVPPRGAAPDVLWGRFAGLLGIEPDTFDLEGSRSNVSLGAEQAELLRRVNAELGDRLRLPGPYPVDVKNVFAQTVLAERRGTPFGLDREGQDFAIRRSAEIAEELRQLDVDVLGSLDELVPEPTDDPQGLQEVPQDVLLSESIAALVGMLDQHRARRQERDKHYVPVQGSREDLARRLNEVTAQRDHLVHDMRHRPVRHLLIGLSERWPWLMAPRVGYWRLANAVRARRQRSA